MLWCGVFLFPAFGILDFWWVTEWTTFVEVRLAAALLMVAVLVADRIRPLPSELIAHLGTQSVITSLMWMMSQIDDPEVFLIYALNSSTAYIASAFFLFWRPVHSILLFTTTLLAFIFFYVVFSSLSPIDIVSKGALPLFTVALVSQLFVHFRGRATVREFRNLAHLNQINSELWLKNHTIEQQSREIRDQNENLEALNELKDKLFVIVSHDFKSPLHSLRGFLDLIDNSVELSREDLMFLARGIRTKVDVTCVFLENILLWTKSQMNGFQVDRHSASIRDIVSEAFDLLRSIAANKKIRITNQTEELHRVRADPEMTRIVIRNLVANAIKFSDEDSEVIVRSCASGDSIVVSVIDRGVGMSDDEISKLLNAKVGFSKRGTASEVGTGLGLMLCREFVEKNDGRLWVESVPGNGTIFSFSLPVCEERTETSPVATTL